MLLFVEWPLAVLIEVEGWHLAGTRVPVAAVLATVCNSGVVRKQALRRLAVRSARAPEHGVSLREYHAPASRQRKYRRRRRDLRAIAAPGATRAMAKHVGGHRSPISRRA